MNFKKMNDQSEMEKKIRKCNAVINGSSVLTGLVGAGCAKLPVSDDFLITPIQTGMTIAIGRIMEKDLSECAAHAVGGTAAARTVGKAAARFAVGKIPVAGEVVNGVTAVAMTQGLGRMLVKDFSK